MGEWTKWNVQLLKQLTESGLRDQEIALRLGCNQKDVFQARKRNGIPCAPYVAPRGPAHPCWKGGTKVDHEGYVLHYCDGHPFAKRGVPYVREHRLVMEAHLGRYLKPGEVVHHKNGDRADNRIENLELFARNADHLRAELTGRCAKWTPEGLEKLAIVWSQRKGIPFGSKTPRAQETPQNSPHC